MELRINSVDLPIYYSKSSRFLVYIGACADFIEFTGWIQLAAWHADE